VGSRAECPKCGEQWRVDLESDGAWVLCDDCAEDMGPELLEAAARYWLERQEEEKREGQQECAPDMDWS